ncbi:family 78 glycoside hydrolase catalytic domain [Candidatus Bathyarchaeota archaeon]|nr:family 78 glycoside hydrolase catalytic domain [Candidatus Bathyarchaeota archaeon]
MLGSPECPVNLLCEYCVDPIGIDAARPRFSWELRHSERGRLQSSYQILVASSEENLRRDFGDIWDSGKVNSSQSANVDYDGKPLESSRTYYWKVRWWDDQDRASPYSRIAKFETGLLSSGEWRAKWITGGNLLRKEFLFKDKFKQARAYVTGLGYYELRINGQKVCDLQLDPGWTDYEKIVLYSVYDVTEVLNEGENAVGIMLGNGRYNVKEHRRNFHKQYGEPRAILQIEIELTDGSRELILTDDSWKASKGPIVDDDLYDGEVYDARLEKEGWDKPGYDDSSWENAKVAEPPSGKMCSQATFPPIRAVKMLQPTSLSNPKPDVYVFDFGQNFTGWARLTVAGPRGTEVRLRYSELLNPDGTINAVPNRDAKATDTYVLKGEGDEVYEPRFTYHGFRYVEVTGFPGVPNISSLQGVVVHSDVKPVGSFSCSNQLINDIHKNTLWGQVSNLMSIPTDCPQRDERMGWMGDAQLSSEEAIFNFWMAAFYTKWVQDIKAAQKEDGGLPDVVPPYWSLYPADPAWGTACVIIPWNMYLYYGDKRVLEENYDVMKGWVEFLGSKCENYILKFCKYGDWCPPGQVKSLTVPGEVVSTLCYYEDVVLLSKIAHIIGRLEDSKKYAELAEKVKEAFNEKYFKNDCYAPLKEVLEQVLATDFSQTANCIPLYLDMVPSDKKEQTVKRLLHDLTVTHDHHVDTGIVGTRYLLDALTKCGQAEAAYKIVSQTTYPSWGYMLKEGATTFWERWEHLTGSGMNSHNHIMFGSVDSWFYKALAGLNVDPSRPGFEKVIIKPHVLGDLNFASASLRTIRGIVASKWCKGEGSLTIEAVIPTNSVGEVHVPTIGLKKPVIMEGNEIVWKDENFVKGVSGVESAIRVDDYVAFQVGSGTYRFKVTGSSA